MDEKKADHLKSVPLSLKAAMRRARVEGVEQSQAVADVRETEIARLEILEEAVRPVLDQLPLDVDIFDAGIAYGERPRLFIDMIGFVEMAHDRRTYRFLQDTRHGRSVITESDRLERVVEAVTNYIARRLVERERALASDWRSRDVAAAVANPPLAETSTATSVDAPPVNSGAPKGFAAFVQGLLVLLGAVTLGAAVVFGAVTLWLNYGRALWSAYIGPPPF
jgi:hypothetical protein